MRESDTMSNQLAQTDESLSAGQGVALLILLAGAMALARVLAVQRVYEPSLFADPNDPADERSRWPQTRPRPMPTFGANDRSRWATIRALVDHGTFAIGKRQFLDEPDPQTGRRYRDTGIVAEDGWGAIDKVLHPKTKEFFSSKPPLLPTVLAGEYWLLQKLFGWDIARDTFEVVRTILVTVNVVPFVIYLVVLAKLAARFCLTAWAWVYALAFASFGTFVSTFLVSLNNHVVATCAVVFSLYPAMRILYDGRQAGWLYLVSGLWAGWMVANELPSAAWATALAVLLMTRSPMRTVAFYVPGAILPVAALLLVNYLAIGEWTPAYGKLQSEWYQYEGSHWIRPRGIDGAQEPLPVYAFHFVLGHHGVLSLTPVFAFTLAGFFWNLGRGYMRMLTAAIVVVTVVVIGFYLMKTRNYGGWTSGPRWTFWLTPLWLVVMVPLLDRIARHRWLRGVAWIVLAWSVLSATYPVYNPWRHPWLYNWLEYWEVIGYR